MTLPTGDWLFYLVAYSAISVLLWILIL